LNTLTAVSRMCEIPILIHYKIKDKLATALG